VVQKTISDEFFEYIFPKFEHFQNQNIMAPNQHKTLSVPSDIPDFIKDCSTRNAFTTKLDKDALQFFNDVCEKPFHEQGVAFLNAYWQEIGDQAEFIFSVSYEMMRYADMHARGIHYLHLYDEGNDLDFNIGLYFYEKLCKKVLDDQEGDIWRNNPKYTPSMPCMMTSIKRKIELRDKVDCNFDGRLSFLEYLLYQYREFSNPADFTHRAMRTMDMEEHPAISKARMALQEVNTAIQAYEAEKHRLESLSSTPGVRGLGAKHQLAILDASPLVEKLNVALIKAEAAIRMAMKQFGNGVTFAADGNHAKVVKPTDGSVFWLEMDLAQKKRLYGRK